MFSHGKLVTVLQYFTDKVEDYWHILYPLESSKNLKKDKFLYFYDISKKVMLYKGQFSDEGIYLFLGYDGKYHMHALEIAQYSLACWIAWRKTESEIWLKKALKHCDWLLKNQEKDGSWKIKHKNPKYKDMNSPWVSALAQGLAISSLIRAYYYTNENKYLYSAIKACEFLEVGINSNGVKRNFVKKGIKGFVYEEYPTKKLNGVLNGYISAVLGICELSKVDSGFTRLFDENINNLLNILSLYDLGYWSLYSLDGNVASGFYHRLVVKQLKVLREFNDEFDVYYSKFKSYQENKLYALRALMNKIKAKI
ncbi:hypothetical protein C3L23_08545 [Nautilia sp. PV-1]|uniref:D-glucuronyl C5-epimerase family protein n=1 Tax=Nautilia sp. PV-1 TaxID=2579250 RepID=UPI000FDC87E0|nr:D-glucuronyl C5-epimerase family protein [Nautilia sp. PV-1]AZV47318.1 hypothetical protein C3L23_08545 [Nautilia sp. PV-1]